MNSVPARIMTDLNLYFPEFSAQEKQSKTTHHDNVCTDILQNKDALGRSPSKAVEQSDASRNCSLKSALLTLANNFLMFFFFNF